MSSQISPNSINQNYPVAGVDNNSQGFRDNFTSIKNNFTITAREINDLMEKAVVKAPLTYGSTPSETNNNFAEAEITGAVFRDCSLSTVSNVDSDGSAPVELSFAAGSVQTVTLTGNNAVTTLAVTDWPSANLKADLQVRVTVQDATHVLALDSGSAYQGTQWVPGYDSLTQQIRFGTPGTYDLLLSTSDGGGNITVTDLSNRPWAVSPASNVTIDTATLADTELSFDTHANVKYHFDADVWFATSLSSAQIQTFAVATGNVSASKIYTVAQQAASDGIYEIYTGTGNASLETFGNTLKHAKISGTVFHTLAGNVAIQAAANTGNIVISSLSSVRYTPLS